jgi:predicted P-loop ATPase/GTPase
MNNNLIDFIYQRLLQNKPFDQLFNPYSKETISKVLSYYESIEEYEKCQIVVKFL